MNSILSILLLIFTLSGFLGCGNDTPVKEEQPQIKTIPKASVFRGINFGMPINQVKRRESAVLIDEDEENMVLSYTLDLNEVEFADIRYTFLEGRLDKIEYDVYTQSKESATDFYQKFEKEFNDFYEGEENIWDGTIKNKRFTVFLKQINVGNNHGVVVVWEVL